MGSEPTNVLLPKLGLEMEEGEIAEWLVEVGERVERGQVIASIDTDKAATDLEAERSGYVVAILHTEGERLPVGTPIAIIADALDAAHPAEPSEPAPAAPPAGPPGTTALPRLRRLTAERMSLSQQVPQFDVFREVDTAGVARLVSRLRARNGDGGARVGVNDVLVKAYARTLAAHPRLNGAFADHDGPVGFVQHDAVHIGLAVATEAGLVAPVIRDAATLALADIAVERGRLVAAARDGALTPEEIAGPTSTLSNLRRFAIDGFNAMIVPPQAAILAVGPARPRPVVRDGAVVAGETMTLTLTVDHRVVDGSESAAALAMLGDLLESDAALNILEDKQ